MEVMSLEKLRHERAFYLMNGRKADVVTFAAHAWYVANDWDTVATAYKDGHQYYLVVKDD